MTASLGLRGRLMLAIVPIALLSVCAAATAVFSFRATEDSQKIVANEAVPALILGQGLYMRSNRLTAIARNVATADNFDAARQATSDMDAVQSAIHDDIRALAALDVDRFILDQFSRQTTELVENIRLLRDTAGTAFELQNTRIALVANTLSAANSIELIATELGTNANMELTNNASTLYELVGNAERRNEAFDTIDQLLDVDAFDAQNMGDLRALSLKIPGLAEQTAAAADQDAIDRVKFWIGPVLTQLESSIASIPQQEMQEKARAGFDVISTGMGANKPGSLFDIRTTELKTAASLEQILSENARISASVAVTADQLLDEMRSKIDGANQAVGQTIDNAATVMIALALAAIVISALILWLYVQRNLLRRLIALNTAMKRLTGGDLETPVHDTGRDEIADMAAAVETFRDNAREAERLRAENHAAEERAEQRRRQALLEMADGFESSVNAMVGDLLGAVTDMRDTADIWRRMPGTMWPAPPMSARHRKTHRAMSVRYHPRPKNCRHRSAKSNVRLPRPRKYRAPPLPRPANPMKPCA
ncbi:HAMP domain-containing protein [Thalassospira sp.]|uniref:HAMP domain-containing protein n=1 Tax=Thalassospira sp. TaxID=1912094 RepID=UPI002735CCDE|nr:HAMP domain-containing protein [Thalassospira sp.]MDP2699417.1 HAMP domain-containing protein [Thalassospira sp.]